MNAEKDSVYRAIYEEYAGKIYGYIFRKIYDAASAEDMKQDIFVTLLFYIQSFAPGYPDNSKAVKKWLFDAADNRLKHYWREHQARDNMEISTELIPNVADPQDILVAAEYELPSWVTPEDRKLLYLKASGYTLKEIANQLGVSYDACRKRHSRLMPDLRKYFRK